MVLDGDRQQKGGVRFAQVRGVFSPSLELRSCTYHALDQPLEDVGPANMPVGCYEKIHAGLYSISFYCETKEEALIAMRCIYIYARKALSSGKCAQVHELLDKLSGTMKTWAMFPVALKLT